jgi:hypothetical protein
LAAIIFPRDASAGTIATMGPVPMSAAIAKSDESVKLNLNLRFRADWLGYGFVYPYVRWARLGKLENELYAPPGGRHLVMLTPSSMTGHRKGSDVMPPMRSRR